MGVRGPRAGTEAQTDGWRSAERARKKQFCQSELLNIAAAPCYYRGRGGALLSLTLHSHCFTTPEDDSLDGPRRPPGLALHRLHKTIVLQLKLPSATILKYMYFFLRPCLSSTEQ